MKKFIYIVTIDIGKESRKLQPFLSVMPYCGDRSCTWDCPCCQSYQEEQREKYEKQQREYQEFLEYEHAEIERIQRILFQRVMNQLLNRNFDFLPPPPLTFPLQRHETYVCGKCSSSSGCTTSNPKCT